MDDERFEDAEEELDKEQKDILQNVKPIKENNQREMEWSGESNEEEYEWDDDDDDYDGDYNFAKGRNCNISAVRAGNAAGNKLKATLQPQEKALGKFLNKIDVGGYEGPKDSYQENRKKEVERRRKDKSDRATVEQVLDPRTKMILFKLLNRGFIKAINGCISTGKEANVYHATGPNDEDRAVKVYKTSILTFKDRDKYVTGEFRFRHGYCKNNPRKMVKTWAEKEMRNLTRMFSGGIPCPEPYILRSHVLVMDFIGCNGWPAPLLKDCTITESKARELYLQCVKMMRDLYWKCKLVHADLSEFNMLYNQVIDRLYVIDVSQSVEHDHPSALAFLRKDCANINEFFRKRDVSTLTVKELFEFVTDPTITEANIDAYLDRLQDCAVRRSKDEVTQQDLVDEEVFKKAFIPRNLDEVIDFERDSLKAKQGNASDVFYPMVTGLKADLTGAKDSPDILMSANDVVGKSGEEPDGDGDKEGDKPDESGEDFSGDDISSEKSEDGDKEANDEENLTRKEHKKLVKEQNRERRKNKIPKHVKKRKEKVAKLRKPKK
eukprot:gene15413-16987_t